MIQRAKTEEKNTSRDEAQWTIYEAIVKWKTKVSEFKWHSHDKVTKLIEMIIIKDELVRNTRYAEKIHTTVYQLDIYKMCRFVFHLWRK